MLLKDEEILPKEEVYSFPFGIPAFGDLVEWVLLPTEQPPFLELHSVERPDLSFILLDPKFVVPYYDPALDKSDYTILHLDSPTDVRSWILCIANIPPDGSLENVTINLRAPLLFNKDQKCAAQCLSHDERWNIRHGLVSVKQEDLSLC